MATINDVAKRAGVSPTTAKRAIRSPDLLAPGTLERVKRAIKELHYEPDQTAGALRRGRSTSIGLMVGNIVEPFFAALTRVIAKTLRARGYSLLIADNEYDPEVEREHLKMFHGHRVSALIMRAAFGQPNLDYLRRMQKNGIYILEIDHFSEGSPFGHVMLDNRACVFEGVRYLAELGHTRIAALGTYHPERIPDERAYAFPDAMRAVGLTVPETYPQIINFNEEEAYQLTHRLMRLPEPPTALFSITGSQAAGAFRALKEQGLRIPEDVSLLTFDNYTWTSLLEPPLDVIEQPVEAMAQEAVDIVLEAVEERALERVVRKRFPGKLIRRRSCAPPPSR